MSITRAQIARQLYANGGYSDFASPSSTTASQDFSTQAMSGGQTNYDGGGSSSDYIPQPPMAQVSTAPIRGGDDNNPYGLRNNFERGLTKALPYVAGFMGANLGGPLAARRLYNLAQTNVEKQQEELNQFTNAINTGSFYVPGQTGLPEGLIAKSDSLLGFQNRAPELTINTGGGDNIIPKLIPETPSDIEGRSSDFDLYAALEGREGMRFGENPYATRGTTQRFADGGLASLRQNYKFGKLVDKVTNAIKKVVKSDVGKAALTAAALYGGSKFLSSPTAGPAFKKFIFGAAGGVTGPTDYASPSSYPRTGGLLNRLPFLGTPTKTNITGELVKKTATEYGISPDSALKLLMSQQNTPIPGYVKYGIPAAMAATYFLSKKEKPDDLNQEMAQNYKDTSGLKEQLATYKPFRFQVPKDFQLVAQGGRIGYERGGDIDPADLPMSKEGFPRYEDELGEEVPYPYDNQEMASDPDPMAELFQMYQEAIRSGQIPRSTTFDEYKELRDEMSARSMEPQMLAYGGRIGYEEGGLMNLGGMEKDYRAEGGFVPIGGKEKADDVPARLSKNEFVFTADAVRNAGEGDIDKGAEVMENVMKHLEAGGTVSEESQGLAGARKMFQTSQRLGEVL